MGDYYNNMNHFSGNLTSQRHNNGNGKRPRKALFWAVTNVKYVGIKL